jgi:hypothetical protein
MNKDQEKKTQKWMTGLFESIENECGLVEAI